jgi:hypothetical protein
MPAPIKTLVRVVAVLLTGLLTGLTAADPALAEGEAVPLARQEALEDAKRWRDARPDYDKQVYDHVIRTHQLTKWGLMGLGAALALLAAILAVTTLGRRGGGLVGVTGGGERRAILRRQAKLEALLERLEASLSRHNSQLSTFRQERVDLQALVVECRAAYTELASDLAADKENPGNEGR